MLYTVLDIETSGFNDGRSVVLSASYITFDSITKERYDSGTLYFWGGDNYHWSEGAYKIHGLSKEFLKQYESDFSYNLAKLFKIIQKSVIVGFNSASFDMPFLKGFYTRLDYPFIYEYDHLDMMQVYRSVLKQSRYSLDAVRDFLKISPIAIAHVHKQMFPQSATNNLQHHDAEYDVTLTYILYKMAETRGYI